MRKQTIAVGSHYWTVADDGTASCYRCGLAKRPENVRMTCPAVPDGRGGWTYSRAAS